MTLSDAANNSHQISALETDSKLHGQLVQGMFVKTNDCKCDVDSTWHWQRLLLLVPDCRACNTYNTEPLLCKDVMRKNTKTIN